MKRADQLALEDFLSSPVWEIFGATPDGHAVARPVEAIPVDHLYDRIVGTEVLLANGERLFASISNVDIKDELLSRRGMLLTIYSHGEHFTLFPPSHPLRRSFGPEQLAAFLRKSINEIFPMQYDLNPLVTGRHPWLAGRIDASAIAEGDIVDVAMAAAMAALRNNRN